MGDIINLKEKTTLEFEVILFLKEYTRPETLLPGRFVHVRRYGQRFDKAGIKYSCDLAVGVSETPKVNWLFYNIPVVGSDNKVVFNDPYIVRSIKGIGDRDLPDVRNTDKLIIYMYSNSLCCMITGSEAKSERRRLRKKIDDILSELKG